MATDLTTAYVVRILDTGETWYRIEGGRFDGMWTADNSGTVPWTSHGLKTSQALGRYPAIEIVE